MAAAEEHLIKRGDGIVLLLTPPFDRIAKDPGYIKGYTPGVRENGGQYTHAALWLLMAYAELGDGDRAGELFSLLNPVNHASSRAAIHKYKVEPYVVAADIYSVPPQTGRGGWTWYTGSAAWMYRAALESILGFKLQGDRFSISPCIPRSWQAYSVTYRRGSTRYRIQVENPHGVCRGIASVEVDGRSQEVAEIPISDDGKIHSIRITLGDRRLLQNESPGETANLDSAPAPV
jgi:cyclic beta-1,2-glucan synthetase